MSTASDRSAKGEPTGQPSYLAPGEHVDAHHPDVIAFARAQTRDANGEREAAVRLYYAVRDGIRYDAYIAGSSPEALRASDVLRVGRGWCVSKAVLLAACCRAVGVGARLGFADVRNHLSTMRMREFMGTDVFYYHGYAQLRIEGRWLKATPAFNVELCEKMGLLPLDFDGSRDSLYHPFDREGKQHMEYIRDHGVFDAVPVEEMVATWSRHYPQAGLGRNLAAAADFESEVDAEICKN
jgi:transglutaminase-like putative cysteine protease